MEQEIDRHTAQAMAGNDLPEQLGLRLRLTFEVVATQQLWCLAVSALDLRERDALRREFEAQQPSCSGFATLEK